MNWKKFAGNLLYPMLSLGALMLIWWIAAKAIDIELIVPGVNTTFRELFVRLGEKAFYAAALGTLFRVCLSFLISLGLSLILAVLSAWLPVIRKLFAPFVMIARAIPTISLILLTVVWLEPKTSPIFISCLILFPVMYANFATAIEGVDKNLIELSRCYRVGKKDMLLSLYLPSIAPSFFDTARSSISLSVKLVVSAEVLAHTRDSMGLMMQTAKNHLDTPNMLSWTLVAIFLSFLMEFVVFGIKKLCIRWER